MKILIFSQHFPPETVATGRRASDLAEAFADGGHQVIVITGQPNHPSSLGLSFCRVAAQDEHTIRGYRVLRVPVLRSADPGVARRLLTYITFMVSAAWRGIKQPRPHVVLAISPLPTGLAAMMAHWWHRAPLVFDLQDIWPDSALAVGVMKRSWLFSWLRRVERYFYGQCAMVVGITEGFRRYLVSLAVSPERTAVIHNSVDWEEFLGAQPNDQLTRTQEWEGEFVVGYVGNIGLAQNLETMLDAAEQLREEHVSFLIVGEGTDKKRLMALARIRGLRKVVFYGGVPREQVPFVLTSCDALLLILRNDPLFKITVPSKLYEYMAAGRPILCSADGEAAELVVEAGCGLPIHPSDGASLAESIRILMRAGSLGRRMGEAGIVCARTRFARSRLMAAYVDLVEDLLSRECMQFRTAHPQS